MNPKLPDDGLPKSLKRYIITAEEAEILSKHPFFHDIPIIEEPPKHPDMQLAITRIGKQIQFWGHLKKE